MHALGSHFRALGENEIAQYRIDRVASLNFCTLTHVQGPEPSLDQLREAAEACARRHPLLRSAIEGSDKRALRFVGAPAGADVRIDAAPGWEGVASDELVRRFDTRSGPLARWVWMPRPRVLLLTLHHSIGDGKSGVFASRDFLRALSGATLPEGEVPRALESRRTREQASDGQLMRFACDQLWADMLYGKGIEARVDRPSHEPAESIHVVHTAWERDRVRALVRRARAEGTTVHGALLAGQVLAHVADHGGRELPVAAGSPICVRGDLAEPAGEDVGFHVSMLMFRDRVSATADFWTLARSIRRSIVEAKEQGTHVMLTRALGDMLRLFGAWDDDERFRARWSRHVPSTFGLTNLGRLPLPERIGEYAIEACHFVVNPSMLADTAATATSTHGNLRWNMVFPLPAFDIDHADALGRDAAERVLVAIES